MSLLEDSPSRLALEQRHGKATLERLVKKCEEDKSNRLWIEGRTTTCPNCQVCQFLYLSWLNQYCWKGRELMEVLISLAPGPC